MRSGANCTVQQTLTTEAASVLKHSLALARRRGHAQVTPLHVAATLLSSRASLFRRACLKSQPHHHHHQSSSHPLQCRALELCFNVALNRLPTTPAPLIHGQPSLSNALIAALKRAQAHQRRGCIEQQQQQPLLTIKVELEQLIISILDDPSVSRVMREAGFSSTAVKNNLEDSSASSVFQYCYSSSGGVFSSPCSPSATDHTTHQREIVNNPSTFWQTHCLTYTSEQNPVLFSPPKTKLPTDYFFTAASDHSSANSVKEDIKLVLEVLLRKKKKNTVIVGDCVSITEGLVCEVIGRIERGEVPAELKETQFIKFQFAPVSLRFMKKEDVEMNLSELKGKLDSLGDQGGAIIYTGDLKWTVEKSVNVNGEVPAGYYSPVEHLVTEIGRLISDYSTSNTKIWLMATASYQTYMRCQMRQPPLEIQWALQAVSVPSGGLGLSLHASSVHDSRITLTQSPSHQAQETKPFISNGKEEQDKSTCCPECNSNYEKEAQSLKSGHQKHLPPWLQPQGTNSNQKDELVELRRKWNRLCHSLHHQGQHNQSHLGSTLYNNQSLIGKSYSYNSSYPWWPSQNSIFPDSTSISFVDSALKPNHSLTCVPKFRRQQSCTIECNFVNGTQKHQAGEPSLDFLKSTEGKETKITLALGHSLFSDLGKLEKGRSDHLSKLLQENVPWQSEIIPSLLEALSVESKSAEKEITWLLVQGNDTVGKKRLALAVAESVLGSPDLLLHMNMRKRDNEMDSYSERLARALRNQEKIVALVEDVDLADTNFVKFLADGFETGNFGESSKREKNIGQAIFILTKCESMICEVHKMNHDPIFQMMLKVNETKTSSFGTPNMDHKRKAEWDISSKVKNPRVNENEDTSWTNPEDGNKIRKDFSRQSSFNSTLDLNIKADEDDESEDKPGEFSPMSSDLTRETTSDPLSLHGFLDSIKSRFVFDRNPAQNREITEVFLSKIKSGFEEVFGNQKEVGFSIEEGVLEKVLEGSGSFLNSLFEKWVKEIFETSLQTVKFRGKGGIVIRLCFGGSSNKVFEDDGFMGTCLPKKIQVS